MTKSTKNSCATVTPRGSENSEGISPPAWCREKAEVCITHGIVYPSGNNAEPLDGRWPSCEGGSILSRARGLSRTPVFASLVAHENTAKADSMEWVQVPSSF